MNLQRKGPTDYRADETTICLVNCYADDNKGDHGIILATLLGLRQAYLDKYKEEPKLFAVSTFGKSDSRNSPAHRFLKKVADRVIPNSVPQRYVESSGFIRNMTKAVSVTVRLTLGVLRIGIYKASGGRAIKVLSKDQRAYVRSGVVVSKGGSIFYSKGGLRAYFFLMRMLSPLLFSILLHKKPIVFAQSIGPFNGKLSRFQARWIFNRCRHVYVRETFSQDLLEELGVIPGRVTVVPDIAFILKSYIKPKVPVRKKKILCVTARNLSSDVRVQAAFESKMASILEGFLKNRPNWIVQFVPQVIGPGKNQDDRVVQKAIKKCMDPGYYRRLVFVDDDLSVEELCALYKEADLLLGTRLHSTIFAATQGTPAVVLEYQQKKALGTFKQLGVEDYVLDWQAPEKKIQEQLAASVKGMVGRTKKLDAATADVVKELEAACKYIINTIEEN